MTKSQTTEDRAAAKDCRYWSYARGRCMRDGSCECAMSTTEPMETTPWPIEKSAEDTLRWIIRACARPAGRARVGVRPRWSVVSDLTSNGSTYSSRLCEWAGTDPDEMVVRQK